MSNNVVVSLFSERDNKLNVIKASAGSGKTYTLAKSYIQQLLYTPGRDGLLELRRTKDYHQHILAITFTNKATNEMKQRIIKELYCLSETPDDSNFMDDFKTECTPEAIQGTQQAARDALATILFNYSTFRVSTNDSFFQHILRSFARELDRDYNYEVQINEKYVVSEVTHNFLMTLGRDHERAGGNTQVEQWVEQYLESQTRDSKSWSSFFSADGGLTEFARDINTEFVRGYLDKLCSYLRDDEGRTYLDRIVKFQKILNDEAERCAQLVEKTDWGGMLTGDLEGIAVDDFNKQNALYKMLTSQKFKPTPSLRGLIANPQAAFKKNRAPGLTVLEAIQQTVKKLYVYQDRAELFKHMAQRLYHVGLLGEISNKLEEYRRDNNSILIADTNELIGKVVASSEEAPFVYERTGTWINSFLLDEFQDTSKKQYENFKPLLKECLSRGDSDNYGLVIGDSKQAIYRFRNADPSVFRDKIDREFRDQINKDTLKVNWRSLANIVDFNNKFTGLLIGAYEEKYTHLRDTYKPTGSVKDYEQEVSPPKKKLAEKGMVRVNFKDNAGTSLSEKETVAAVLPQYLLDLHERFNWRDIIILVDTNKEGAMVVDSVLEHNKKMHDEHPESEIPIVSGQMMRLQRSAAVRRIVNLLRFIDLTTYACGDEDIQEEVRSEAEMYKNRKRFAAQRQMLVFSDFVKRVGLMKEITPREAGDILMKCFADAPKDDVLNYALILEKFLPDHRTELMSLVNIVEKLISLYIADFESDDETIYLHAFQNQVLTFASRSNGGTVREFLRYWDQNNGNITVPDAGSLDAVNVLTIHKSKGLEADCVVIPFASWVIGREDHAFWVDGKTWLNCGGLQLLKESDCKDWDESLVPPIMRINANALRNMGESHDMFKEIYSIEDEDALIDSVNKTYVAFTRPRKELHIFAVGDFDKKKKTKKSTATIGDALADIIPSMTTFSMVTDGQYQMGEPCPSSVSDFEDDGVKLPSYSVGASKVEISLPEDDDSMRETGKKLHAVMNRIGNSTQIDKAINYCKRRGIISDTMGDGWDETLLRQRLSLINTDERVARWFDAGNRVYNERPLLEVKNGEPIVRRPDRIVQVDDKTLVVVDYKFGQHNDAKYKRQVKAYMDILAQATGMTVEGYIWYVADGEIVDV